MNMNFPILIIDDMKQVIDSLKIDLSSIGYTNTYAALSGEEGLELISNSYKTDNPIKLVFLDVNMPGLKGPEILKILREISNYNDLKIVMLTTSNEKVNILESVKLGANNYILKPYSIDELKQKIKPLFS